MTREGREAVSRPLTAGPVLLDCTKLVSPHPFRMKTPPKKKARENDSALKVPFQTSLTSIVRRLGNAVVGRSPLLDKIGLAQGQMASSRTNVTRLVALGIPKPKALYALQEFDGNAEVAADWCFTVSHSGVSSDVGDRSPSVRRGGSLSLLPLTWSEWTDRLNRQEGAEWTPNDLLQTSHVRPTSALSAESSTLDLSRVDPRTSTSSPARSGSGMRNHTPPGWTLVPARDVTPGTKVSITLKQDQGTDRTVEGVVAERLTRGDHPRGVKVRLRDGRVGRVVRILDARDATV